MLDTCWEVDPGGQPQDPGTHHTHHTHIPSLMPAWQRGRNPQGLPSCGPKEPRAGLCHHTSCAMTVESGVVLHAWLEVSSGKVHPLGGPKQESLDGNSGHRGKGNRALRHAFFELGCQVPAPFIWEQAQQSPHQKFKETEHIEGWEEGQARSLQNGPPEILEAHGRWSEILCGWQVGCVEKEAEKGQAPGCPLPSRKDPHPGQPPFSLIH